MIEIHPQLERRKVRYFNNQRHVLTTQVNPQKITNKKRSNCSMSILTLLWQCKVQTAHESNGQTSRLENAIAHVLHPSRQVLDAYQIHDASNKGVIDD